MSDPLRTNPIENTASTDGDAERDAKIESLLLAGLDQYFAADYAQAIDIWTRALFLDRSHARARAYIERARSAMAEQQRESEELLHNGVAAFERGEIEAARQMLNAAVQRGGAHDVALAFLTRIDRIHAATPAERAPVTAPSRLPFRPRAAASARRGSRWVSAMFLILLIATSVVAIASWDQLQVWIPALNTGAQDGLAPTRVVQEPLIVPRSSETALERALALRASGRLYDAIRAVELVRPTDPLRGDADKLKADIQKEILAFQTSPGGAELTTPPNSTNPTVPMNPATPRQ
jgi:tetratricopeptide (TPR) repeat protein